MRKPMTAKERLMRHVRILENGCWEWTGCTCFGYGRISNCGTVNSRLAHVASYIEFVGPIPEGKELDHTCHKKEECYGGVLCPHRRCINPDHLEPVTRKENVRRGHGNSRAVAKQKAKKKCKHGHRYTEKNTYWYRGYRMCRTCQRVNEANRRKDRSHL